MFRGILLIVFVANLGISAYFRWKARQGGEAIARGAESAVLIVLRLVFALPLFLSILAYLIHPAWMAWAAVPMPEAVRWVGAVLGLALVPLTYWVFVTIGRNISETVLTKTTHELVTTGPYRWVRHPLYTVGTLLLVAVTLLSANAFIGGMTVLAITMVALVVIPREEANLIETFGDAYRAYQSNTGMLLPRLW